MKKSYRLEINNDEQEASKNIALTKHARPKEREVCLTEGAFILASLGIGGHRCANFCPPTSADAHRRSYERTITGTQSM